MINRKLTVAALTSAAFACPLFAQDDAPKAESAPVVEVPTLSFLEGWKGEASAGVYGASGNTEQFNARAGVAINRATDETKDTIRLNYNYANSDGEKTSSRFTADAQHDWLLPDSKWYYFAQGQFVYDEFQDWDYRLGAYGGAGYELIKNDTTTLMSKFGLGASQDVGGEEDDVRFEGILGLNLEHTINDRQKLVAGVELFPELSDFGQFRVDSHVAWEIMLNEENSMKLRLGIEDRYTSNVGDGIKKNDINYFLEIAMSF